MLLVRGTSVNLSEKQQFKMLVVFSPVFGAGTKIIFVYNFVAPLNVKKGNKINHIFKNLF